MKFNDQSFLAILFFFITQDMSMLWPFLFGTMTKYNDKSRSLHLKMKSKVHDWLKDNFITHISWIHLTRQQQMTTYKDQHEKNIFLISNNLFFIFELFNLLQLGRIPISLAQWMYIKMNMVKMKDSNLWLIDVRQITLK